MCLISEWPIIGSSQGKLVSGAIQVGLSNIMIFYVCVSVSTTSQGGELTSVHACIMFRNLGFTFRKFYSTNLGLKKKKSHEIFGSKTGCHFLRRKIPR